MSQCQWHQPICLPPEPKREIVLTLLFLARPNAGSSRAPPQKKTHKNNFYHSDEPYQRIWLKENEGAHSFMPIPISSCTYELSVLCLKTSLNSSSTWLTGLNTETKVMTPEREIAPYEVPRPSLLPWALEKNNLWIEILISTTIFSDEIACWFQGLSLK